MKFLANLSLWKPITSPPVVDAVILDGAVIVQMLLPKTAHTFEEYFTTMVAPYILKILQSAKRVDLVWDVYKEDSLKKYLRNKKGSGQRRKVTASTRIPKIGKDFLEQTKTRMRCSNFS